MNAKIPFQPGLALGSIVRGDIIDKMIKYGDVLSTTEAVEKEIRGLEQSITVLNSKISSLQAKKGRKRSDTTNTALLNLYKANLKLLQEKLEKLPGKIEEISGNMIGCLPSFTNITTGLTTPINFDLSEVVTSPRGFDSISYNSQYINMKESDERITDKMDQSSTSMSASTNSSGFSGFGGSGSFSCAVMDRVAAIKNQGHASSVLVINAFVTTRNVRFIKNKKYDIENLKGILKIMSDSSSKEKLNKYGITTEEGAGKDKKSIYLLTEAVLGGSFSAIVTYLNEDSSSRDVRDSARHASVQTEASYGYWLSTSATSQRSKESHDDYIKSLGNMNVTVEFIAQGAIPQLARDTVVRETLKHQGQTLRQYASSGSEGKDMSIQERQMELQKANYEAINNTNRKTAIDKEEISIHSVNSVLKAYDDFCGEITVDDSCGVPVGFNYEILTEEKIKEIVKDAAKIASEGKSDDKKHELNNEGKKEG